MRFGFVTCVRLGLSCMEAIYETGGALDLAVTLPADRARSKSGRVYIDEFCASRAIPLVTSPHVNDPAVLSAVQDAGIDWLFVIGWSQIVGPRLLRAPTRGVLGMHPTLLPEGRGRASIPWAIIKGLDRSGVTLFQLDEGVDTGPILAQHVIELRPDTTATLLYQQVANAHGELIRSAWPLLVEDRAVLVPQEPGSGSGWEGRSPSDGEILGSSTLEAALTLVRATTRPYPGAFFPLADGLVRVWSARPAVESPTGPTFHVVDGTLEAVDFGLEPCLREAVPQGA